eukprot:2623788-Pleurochrysis_carterae.AAC.3
MSSSAATLMSDAHMPPSSPPFLCPPVRVGAAPRVLARESSGHARRAKQGARGGETVASQRELAAQHSRRDDLTDDDA